MRKLLFVILLFSTLSSLAQSGKRTLLTDKAKVREVIELRGTPIDSFMRDSTLQGATDRMIPTAKAVKDYVDNNGGSGGGGSADNLGNHTATQNLNFGSFWLGPDGTNRGLSFSGNDVFIKSFPLATTTLILNSFSGSASVGAQDSDSEVDLVFNTSSDYASLQFNGLVNYRFYEDYQTIIPPTSNPSFTPSSAYFYMWAVRPSGIGSGKVRYRDGSGAIKTVASEEYVQNNIGNAVVEIPVVQTGLTTSVLSLDAEQSNIFHINAAPNQDCVVNLSNAINGNIYTLQFSGNTSNDTITLNQFYVIDSIGNRDTIAGVTYSNFVIQAFFDSAFQVISCVPDCKIKTEGSGGGVGSSFDADYQAVLDYAVTQGYALPDDSIQTKQNQLVLDLKSNNIWDSLKVFTPYASTSVLDSSFSLINWVDPSLNLQTKEGSPVFVAGQGWQGSTVNDYLETGYSFNGTTEGAVGAWLYSSTTSGSSFLFGTSSDNSASLYVQAYNIVINNQYSKWTTSVAPIEGTSSGSGLQSTVQGSGTQRMYIGGTENGSKSSSAANVSNRSINVLRVNALSPSIFSDNTVTISAFYIADFHSPASVAAMNAALSTYISGL